MQAAAMHAGHGHMQGVRRPLRRDHAGLETGVAQTNRFHGDADEFRPRQMLLMDPPDALGRFLKFIDDDFRDDQLESPALT